MLESAGIRWCYHVLSTIALLVELLWIYVLQFRSPPEMKLYKWVLVKLAWLEFLFAALLGLFLFPDLLFPAPGVAILGFAGGWGHEAGVHVTFAVLLTAWAMFMSVNDCLHVRNLFIHENDQMIRLIFTWYIGPPLALLGGLLSGIPLGITFYNALMDPKVFLAEMQSLGDIKYVEYYVKNGAPIVAMDIHNIWAALFGGLIIFGLVLCYAINMVAALVMLQKLNGMRSHMSAQTFRAHQSIIRMLIVQNIYPALVLVIPCSVCLYGFLAKDWNVVGSNLYKHWALAGFYSFPIISFTCSIYYMKPYREYLISFFWKEETPRARVSSTSGMDDAPTAASTPSTGNSQRFQRI